MTLISNSSYPLGCVLRHTPFFRDRVWDDQVEKSCIVADQRLVTGLSTDVYRLVDRGLRGLLSLAHPLRAVSPLSFCLTCSCPCGTSGSDRLLALFHAKSALPHPECSRERLAEGESLRGSAPQQWGSRETRSVQTMVFFRVLHTCSSVELVALFWAPGRPEQLVARETRTDRSRRS